MSTIPAALLLMVFAQTPPRIQVEDGVLALTPSTGSFAKVKGELRAEALSLQQGDAPPTDVMDSLRQCRADSAALEASASRLASEVTNLTAALSTTIESSGGAISALQSTVAELRSTMTAELSSGLAAVRADMATGHSELRTHTIETVSNAHENHSAALIDVVDNMTALFEEYDSRDAGVWEYTFAGSARINQNFAYWFSIDHGGQGAANNTGPGIGDSYTSGNWFVQVEAKAGHCGGGCHVNYFNQRLYFNAYCSKNYMWNRNVQQGHGQVWSVNRVADAHNGHGDVCHTFNVRHAAGLYRYGGPYWIKIRSTKPLVVLHSHPWGACSFIRSGINTAVRRQTVYPSRNCPGHRAPPCECRSGSRCDSNIGIRTDPTDPLYNNTRFRGSCCVQGQNCPR